MAFTLSANQTSPIRSLMDDDYSPHQRITGIHTTCYNNTAIMEATRSMCTAIKLPTITNKLNYWSNSE